MEVKRSREPFLGVRNVLVVGIRFRVLFIFVLAGLAGAKTADATSIVVGNIMTGVPVFARNPPNVISPFEGSPFEGVTAWITGAPINALPIWSVNNWNPFEEVGFEVTPTGLLSSNLDGANTLAPDGFIGITITLDRSTAGRFGTAGHFGEHSVRVTEEGTLESVWFDISTPVSIYDPTNASFDQHSDINELTIDFGTLSVGAPVTESVSIWNLESTISFTATLGLSRALGPVSGHALSVPGFFDHDVLIDAGMPEAFEVRFDRSTPGDYSTRWILDFVDTIPGLGFSGDLGGATHNLLTLNVRGSVVPVSAPATPGLLLIGLSVLGLLRSPGRRRRARNACLRRFL